MNRRLAWNTTLAVAVVAALTVGSLHASTRWVGVARATLRSAPPAAGCVTTVGAVAALEQDRPPSCAPSIGALSIPVLRAIALDVGAPPQRRATALRWLDAGGADTRGLVEAVLTSPATAPADRRAFWSAANDGDDGVEWTERARAVAVHGLFDDATVALAAAGDVSAYLPAAEAIEHGAEDTRVRDAWRQDRDPAPLLREVARGAGHEPASPVLLAEHPDGPADLASCRRAVGLLSPHPEHLGDELAAVVGWIRGVSSPRRPARVRAAILHPRADPPAAGHPAVSGDAHAALRLGRGSVGVSALLAEVLGELSGVDVALAVRDGRVWATVGGVAAPLGGCADAEPRRIDLSPGDLPSGAGVALGLLDAAERHLRNDPHPDLAYARDAVAEAAARWPGAPGLSRARAALRAARPPPTELPPPLRDPGPPVLRGRGAARWAAAWTAWNTRESVRAALTAEAAAWDTLLGPDGPAAALPPDPSACW